MKFINYRYHGQNAFGIVTEKGIISLECANRKWGKHYPLSLNDVFTFNPGDFDELLQKEDEFIPESGIEYLPAVTDPEKIICIGFNYLDHSKEVKVKIPHEPIVFSKFNNALAAHQEKIRITSYLNKVDYEAKLVVIIGKTCCNVSRSDALDHVFGYTCGNDISERSLQFLTGQWLIGKSLDQFAPMGPYAVTKDMIKPSDVMVRCHLNGRLVQESSTANMIFDVPEIISYLSRYITLKPGDVIFTGTPSGVILGKAETEQIWLKPGDKVEVSIEGIGSLVNEFF